jgi:hypothetical protein
MSKLPLFPLSFHPPASGLLLPTSGCRMLHANSQCSHRRVQVRTPSWRLPKDVHTARSSTLRDSNLTGPFRHSPRAYMPRSPPRFDDTLGPLRRKRDPEGSPALSTGPFVRRPSTTQPLRFAATPPSPFKPSYGSNIRQYHSGILRTCRVLTSTNSVDTGSCALRCYIATRSTAMSAHH